MSRGMNPAVIEWVNGMGGSFGLVGKLACGQTKKSPGIAPRASSKVGVCLCVLDEGETYEVDSSRLAALDGGHLCAEPDGGGRCDVLAVPNSVALYWA